jgi:hypothetical protein
MRRVLARLLTALVGGLAALPAAASFHLFAINEIYSNADGTVQFLEMTALANGQGLINGHSLTSTNGSGVTYSVTLTASLPDDTAGHRVLFATQGFASLGIVTPDYILPDNFFFPAGGTVNWGEGSDIWTYPALPIDGTRSLNRDGSTATNSPRNFAGTPGPSLTYQALWWASPPGSESGWGVNITHQGDTLFATWFTYDLDGSPMWLVMSNGQLTTPGTFSGPLYRTTGPAFSSVPFNSSQVSLTQVGSATFTFQDPATGTFSYTVNGVTQTKAITPQIFANGVPECRAGGDPPTIAIFQDLWWRFPAGSESGWGVNITQQGTTIFATWFTYAADGKGMWIVMDSGFQQGPTTFTGDLYRTSGPPFNAVPWNSAAVQVTRVGTGTFAFTDANNGTFQYTVDGISQTKAITRQVFDSPVSMCNKP